MIKAWNYTEDYNEWAEYLRTHTKEVNFIFPDNTATVGRYCIAPQFICNDNNFQAITKMVNEKNLNDAIKDFAVLYCIFKSKDRPIDNPTANYYFIRGVEKSKFEERNLYEI